MNDLGIDIIPWLLGKDQTVLTCIIDLMTL